MQTPCSPSIDCSQKSSHCNLYSTSCQSVHDKCYQKYPRLNLHSDSCKTYKESWTKPLVEIHEENTINIDLPPLSWHGYDCVPKTLSACNTGRTILINGQWAHSRPYIKGGPLNGSYIFSHIHFHGPSEHEIDGKRYPLEMHVVHYKTSYLTQDRAMSKKDGTIVLVIDAKMTALSHVTKLASCLDKINSRKETMKISLDQIVKPFISNYYLYWGSVSTQKNSYVLQWIINCHHLNVTKQEVDDMLNIMNYCESFNSNPLARMKPTDDAIFHVGEVDCNFHCKNSKSMEKCFSSSEVYLENCQNASTNKHKSKSFINKKGSHASLTSLNEKKQEKHKIIDKSEKCLKIMINKSTNTSPLSSKTDICEKKKSKSAEKIDSQSQTEEVQKTKSIDELNLSEKIKMENNSSKSKSPAKENKFKEEKNKKSKSAEKIDNQSQTEEVQKTKSIDELNISEKNKMGNKSSKSKSPAKENKFKEEKNKKSKSTEKIGNQSQTEEVQKTKNIDELNLSKKNKMENKSSKSKSPAKENKFKEGKNRKKQ